MEINPRLFEPIHFYAQMMRSLGRYEDAARLFERAGMVRVEDYQALALAANMYEAIGDEATAQRLSQETVARVERALDLEPGDARALILGAGILLRFDQKNKALDWATRALAADPQSNGVAYNFGCIYARLGDTDKALDMIERAIELGSRNRRYFETDPDFNGLREHPRFKALLDSI